MSKLYLKILDKPRKAVFRKLAHFSHLGSLAGGTALAFQLGHRYSYDFDIFSLSSISPKLILSVQEVFGKNIQKLADSKGELSFLTPDKVKISFIHFPFSPLHSPVDTGSISLFQLKDLASNKAYVIGRRGEYRDYVDMFFLLKAGLKLNKIINEAEKRFGGAFSERLFLEQLIYFDDLKDFRIDFLKKKYTPQQVLKFFQSEVQKYKF